MKEFAKKVRYRVLKKYKTGSCNKKYSRFWTSYRALLNLSSENEKSTKYIDHNHPPKLRGQARRGQARRALIGETTKMTMVTLEELQKPQPKNLPTGQQLFVHSTNLTLQKSGKKKALLKENHKTHLQFATSHVGDPSNMWKVFWLDETKMQNVGFGGNLRLSTPSPPWNMVGGNIMLCQCFFFSTEREAGQSL